MKTALISQYFGIGDVIFAQNIAHSYVEKGYDVIWPVRNHFVEGLSKAYPRITFVDEKLIKPEYFNIREFKEIDNTLIVPIRWSDNYRGLPYSQTMRSKYLMMGMDFNDWKKRAMWVRNIFREDELYYDVLRLDDGMRYNLISERFGTNSESSATVEVNNGLPNVEMKTIPGFSLFDWAMVIQRASHIHVVSSAIFYLLELLQIKADIHLYTRRPLEKDFDNIRYLMTKPYVLHEERVMCRVQHLWDGIAPIVNEEIHVDQNVDLIGKICDCGKFVYSEGVCSCPSKKKWEVKLLDV